MNSHITCLILIALLFGSYAQPVAAGESKLSANLINDSSSSAELKSLMMDSLRNISIYRYSVNISSKMEIDSKNSFNKSNYTKISSSEGIVNLTGQSMCSIESSSEISEGGNTVSLTNEMYILNKTSYTKFNNTWRQRKLDNVEKILDNKNMIVNESKMLNNSGIELLGFEEIDGKECYRIRIKPNLRTFDLSLFETESTLPFENIDLAKLFSMSNFEWTSWITKDTHYLKKNDIKITLTVTPEDLGFPAKDADNIEARIAARVTTLYGDYNQPILMNFSKDFKIAYPFPIKGTSATIFGVIQDDKRENGYSYDEQKIYIDVASSGHFKANLVDVDDRYYEHVRHIGASDRGFLTFELPYGTKIKKIRFEPDSYYQEGSPFSLDLRLDQLGYVIRNPIKRAGFSASDGEIYIEIYSINEGNDYYSFSEPHLVDLIIDLKVTNRDANELPLDLDDFGLIDQFGWEYTAKSISGSPNLGSLLQGESRRFDLIVSEVSELSDPAILKYKHLRINIV